MKYLRCLIALLLLCYAPALRAQQLSIDDIAALLSGKAPLAAGMQARGFSKVYGGPRKAGGLLFRYHHKARHEYLFCYAGDDERLTSLCYYLPQKAQGRKIAAAGRGHAFRTTLAGATRYEDGNIYYAVVFSLPEQ